MPESLKAQYRITEDDYVQVMRWNAWRNLVARPSAATLVAGGCILILLGIAIWKLPAAGPVFAFTATMFAILYALALFVAVPRRCRRHYRQYKAIQEPITVELSDDGLRFSAADGESMVPWPNIFQWRQNQQFVLVYKMPLLFHIVPKSIARDGFDIALLVRRLAEHVGPEHHTVLKFTTRERSDGRLPVKRPSEQDHKPKPTATRRNLHPTGLVPESLAAQALDFMVNRRLHLLGLAAAAELAASDCRYNYWCASEVKRADLSDDGWLRFFEKSEAIHEKGKAAMAAFRAGGSLEALCHELAEVTCLLNERSYSTQRV